MKNNYNHIPIKGERKISVQHNVWMRRYNIKVFKKMLNRVFSGNQNV